MMKSSLSSAAVLMVLSSVGTSAGLQLKGDGEGSPNIAIVVNVINPPTKTIMMGPRRKLTAKEVQEDDGFGRALAVENGLVLVGAPYSGHAYIMDASGNATVSEIKLLGNGEEVDADFGSVVALGDGVAVVGAGYGGTFSLFDARRGGALMGKAESEVPSFVSAVAVDEGLIVVGGSAAGSSQHGCQHGCAYVYESATGKLKTKLSAEDADSGFRFGTAVAVDRGVIVVSGDGSAYVFAEDGHQVSKLTPDDPQADSEFGFAVAVDGDDGVIVVGAPWGTKAAFLDGAAYIFDTNGNQKDELAGSGKELAHFGSAVAVNNGVVVVGAPGEDDEEEDESVVEDFEQEGNNEMKEPLWACGSAYVFDTSGRLAAKLRADDAKLMSQYGWSVAVDSEVIVVGSKWGSVFSHDFWTF